MRLHNKIQVLGVLNTHLVAYPTPMNLNWAWNGGSLAGIMLASQMLTGILLAMHYVSHVDYAFASVQHLMTDVPSGMILRYTHANGASLFFIVVYLHILRGMYYNSGTQPRELVWITGVVILLVMIITAFIGYVLPWGQMSFWGGLFIAPNGLWYQVCAFGWRLGDCRLVLSTVYVLVSVFYLVSIVWFLVGNYTLDYLGGGLLCLLCYLGYHLLFYGLAGSVCPMLQNFGGNVYVFSGAVVSMAAFFVPRIRADKRYGPHSWEFVQLAVGLLLGDAHMEVHGNGYRMTMQQEHTNLGYFRQVYSMLLKLGYVNPDYDKTLNPNFRDKEYKGNSSTRVIYRLHTFTFLSLQFLHSLFYVGIYKLVNPFVRMVSGLRSLSQSFMIT